MAEGGRGADLRTAVPRTAPDPAPAAVLLTGARGAGKSTLCLRLAASCPGRFAGLACPALFDGEGRKAGFLARRLDTGESWELGRSDRELDGPRTGRFSFSLPGIERAVACLRGALGRRGMVTVIDEIGPLELRQGLGFAPVLPLLDGAGDLLITVRPELAGELAALLPRHRVETLLLEEGRGKRTERRILEILCHGNPTGR